MILVLEHQDVQGYLASNEQPDGTELYGLKSWVAAFGPQDVPEDPWRYWKADGCQHGVVTHDRDAPCQPHLKPQKWMANFNLGPLALRCQTSVGLVPASHEHQMIRGSRPDESGRWINLAKASGAYVGPLCSTYLQCAQAALDGIKTRKVTRRSGLTEALQKDALWAGAVAVAEPSSKVPPDLTPGGWSHPVEEYVYRKGELCRIDTDSSAVCSAAPQTEPASAYAQKNNSPQKKEEHVACGPGDRAACQPPAPGAAAGPSASVAPEDPAEEARREKQLGLAHERAKVLWRNRARDKKGDEQRADIAVYRHSGEVLQADPRRPPSPRLRW